MQRDEQHPLGGAEVAAVDAGAEDTGVQRRAAVRSRRGRAGPASRDSHGWTTTSTQARPISTGTIAWNAAGRQRQQQQPHPVTAADQRGGAEPHAAAGRWPAQLGAVADRAAGRAGDEARRCC